MSGHYYRSVLPNKTINGTSINSGHASGAGNEPAAIKLHLLLLESKSRKIKFDLNKTSQMLKLYDIHSFKAKIQECMLI